VLQEPVDVKRVAGRPRCAQTHKCILEAAADLLETEPYRNISIDRIAAEAKVGKQTIYRWWETKADLVLEAYLDRILGDRPCCATTGDALADLRADLRGMIEGLNTVACATAFRGLYAEAQLDDAFRQRFADLFIASLQRASRPLFDNGIAIGQLRPDLNIDLAFQVLHGSLVGRFLSSYGTIELEAADRLIAFLAPSLLAPGRAHVAEITAPRAEGARADQMEPAWVF
jgi:AcrR family transcriptional regulator